MVITEIFYTSRFVKDFRKLPTDKQRVAIKREKLFKQNPFSSALRTHKLSGKLQGYWSFSITHSDRVLFRFEGKNSAIFYKIGSHAIYSR
jgi:mRNA-degrading endonuclease YafQ of YafQ-DinJ toxin-antitoxin module